MISLLVGSVRSIQSDRIIVEVGGVGFTVLVTSSTASQATLGAQIQLFTSLVVREDSLTLFGFLQDESRSLFELLQTVSGIGPKVALSILSALSPEDLGRAVAQEDIAAIEKTPGIGRKGAQRLILELKGKLGELSHSQQYKAHQPAWREQLTGALVSLGFSPRESDAAISDVVNEVAAQGRDASNLEMSELLKLALVSGKSSRG